MVAICAAAELLSGFYLICSYVNVSLKMFYKNDSQKFKFQKLDDI